MDKTKKAGQRGKDTLSAAQMQNLFREFMFIGAKTEANSFAFTKLCETLTNPPPRVMKHIGDSFPDMKVCTKMTSLFVRSFPSHLFDHTKLDAVMGDMHVSKEDVQRDMMTPEQFRMLQAFQADNRK